MLRVRTSLPQEFPSLLLFHGDDLPIDSDTRKSWRDRDFANGGEDVVGQVTADALGGPDVRFVAESYLLGKQLETRINETTRRDKALGDLAALDRAFTWIYETSQDEHLLKAVDQCSAMRISDTSMRITDQCSPLVILPALNFSVTCQALGVEPAKMCEYLDRLYDIILDGDRVVYASLRHDWKDTHDQYIRDRLRELRYTRPHLLRQLARTLTEDLNKLLSFVDLKQKCYLSEASARFLMRITTLCACLVSYKVKDSWTFTSCLVSHFDALLESSDSLPGLASTLFELLSFFNTETIAGSCEFLMLCP